MAIKTLLSTLWLNRRHFKMQIFGVSVFICVLIFSLNLLSIKVDYDKAVDKYLSSKVTYSTSFEMSKSSTKVNVSRLFVDSTKTKCFILLSFDNMYTLSADANSYQVFITNTGKGAKKIKENMTGEIYMFGADGSMGIYLQSDIPFENQPKLITLRSYSNISNVSNKNNSKKYDDGRFVINPGGTEAKTISFLEYHMPGTDFNYTDIYRQAFAVSREAEIRQNIEQSYDYMKEDFLRLKEYSERLRNLYNVKVPQLPYYFDGDGFETVKIYDNDGNAVGSYLRFVPKTIVPGGTEYDWYRGNIVTSYYSLVPNTKKKTIAQYLQDMTSDGYAREKVASVASDEWYYTDGTPVELKAEKISTSVERNVKSAIDDYETALQDIMDIKKQYQTEYLRQLLELERDSDFSGQVYTVDRKTEVVVTY